MKQLILLLIICLTSSTFHAQSIFEDALALSTYLKDESLNPERREEIIGILSHYVKADEAGVVSYFKNSSNNPYISRLLGEEFVLPEMKEEEDDIDKIGDFEASPRTQTTEYGIAGSVGGLPATAFADGLAKFLVERTRAELNMAFVNRFRDFLIKTPEMSILFPSTSQALMGIDRDIFRYSYFLESIRNTTKSDVKGLVGNLKVYVARPDFPVFKDQPTLKAFLPSIIGLSESLKEGIHPAEVLNRLANENLGVEDPLAGNIQSSFKLVNYLSQAFTKQDGGAGRQWVNSNEVAKLLNNRQGASIFLGLLYHRADGFTFGATKVRLKDVLGRIAGVDAQIQDLLHMLQEFSRVTTTLDDQGVAMSRQSSAAASQQQTLSFQDYFSRTTNLVVQGIAIKKHLFGMTDSTEIKVTDKIVNVLRLSNQLSGDIKEKQHTAAILHLTLLLAELIDGPRMDKLRSGVMRYGSFMASIADAQTSEEVKHIVEAFALPVGSSAIKKHFNFNISLNAYVGPTAGFENYIDFNAIGSKPFVALHAPVGIAASWGMNGHSVSAFFPIIDIGAFTAFRFEDPYSASLPEINFSNIIAPGAYIVWGIPKVPISVGFGGQMGPNLRKININSAQIEGRAWRIGAFISVDIPIVNIYTSGR